MPKFYDRYYYDDEYETDYELEEKKRREQAEYEAWKQDQELTKQGRNNGIHGADVHI